MSNLLSIDSTSSHIHVPRKAKAASVDAEAWRLLPHTHGYIASEGFWRPFPHLQFLGRAVARAVANGGRLIINLPPQHGKSEFVSHRVPAWFLDMFPDRRVILAGYSDEFAHEWGRKVRDSIAGFSGALTRIRSDSSSARRWDTTHGGGMIAVGVGGALTGRGANLAIVDDPIKNWEEARSEVYRRRISEWFDAVLLTRLRQGGAIVVLMTRWHPDDLTGYLLQKGGWDCITLPGLAEADDPLGRQVGEALCPELFTTETLLARRAETRGFVWDGLYQQRPSVPEGQIIKREWIQFYDSLPQKFDRMIQSWDCAFKGTSTSDFVVGQVWGMVGANAYLLDQVRERLSFTETISAVRRLSKAWPTASAKYVEEKANGAAVIDALRREIPGLIPHAPQGSKESRLNAVSHFFEAGNVHIPRAAVWTNAYVDELCAFPAVSHDDQVDATSQALAHLLSCNSKRVGISWS